MPEIEKTQYIILLLFLSICFYYLFKSKSLDDLSGVSITEILKVHNETMPKEQIIKVREGVWVAVGFAIANSILIEGEDGAVIVDTTESVVAAKVIAERFTQLTDKPVTDIVYTHSHADHVTGTKAFIKNGDDVRIWAHESFYSAHVHTLMSGPRVNWGAVHQFGTQLGQHRADCGIGKKLVLDKLDEIPYPTLPNTLIRQDVEKHVIQGIEMTFIHIPGETSDHIGIWIEDWKILLPGDNIYRTFPNIYAIRGTPPRSALVWADSLQKIRNLNAEILVPSHTLPVFGEREIYDLLTVYLSAIRFVHDQTLRFVNKGWNPEDVSQHIRLPDKLRDHPYIHEFYGKVKWSSKAVAENYVGWFSGDPADLQPLTNADRAARLRDLVGVAKLVKATETALRRGDDQWALELSSHLVRLEPRNAVYRNLKFEALKKLAGRENNPPARHYYLTEALALRDKIDYTLPPGNALMSLSLDKIFDVLTTKLKAELVEDVNATVIFRFTDLRESYRLTLQFSVVVVDKMAEGSESDDQWLHRADLTVTTTSVVWRELLAQRRNPLVAYFNGDIRIKGGLFAFRTFMSYFEKAGE